MSADTMTPDSRTAPKPALAAPDQTRVCPTCKGSGRVTSATAKRLARPRASGWTLSQGCWLASAVEKADPYLEMVPYPFDVKHDDRVPWIKFVNHRTGRTYTFYTLAQVERVVGPLAR